MARRPGYAPQRIASILAVLAKHPEGIWMRKLESEAGLDKKTIRRYIEGPLAPVVEVTALGEKPLLKVVRLKPAVFQRLGEGQNLEQVIRLMGLIERSKK
jgi:hypothetical protein